ncbi:MAG: phosphate acyltransferase PlsX [Alphaproteobacteria bacterium]|nr:phosphate acyltransferase PlsX [Alphaproteobacteria bacterium]
MGGDHGVTEAMRGAARLSLEDSDIHVLCVGDVAAMDAVLGETQHDPSRLTLVRSGGAVPMEARPRTALAELPSCSVLTAARVVEDGGADALVSAGNTGATVLSAAETFSILPGIRRAALASVYPTAQPHGPKGDPFALMLDVGATLHATAEDLVGFALMGTAYSSVVSEIASPRVALLSNGAEASKGTAAIVDAHGRLLDGPLHFSGNVEGLDIPKGSVDVIVCDGFLGNVVLKMLEGMGDVLSSLAAEASARRLQWRIGLSMLSGGLREIQRLTDWKMYGGAPLLGFDRVVIKAHGRSEAGAIRNAIKVAAKTVRGDLLGRIEDGVSALRLDGSP